MKRAFGMLLLAIGCGAEVEQATSEDSFVADVPVGGGGGGGDYFDIGTFHLNLLQALDDGATVGYAYAINVDGFLWAANGVGDARTGDDPPQTAQSATKRMNIASISKTITAVAVLQ